MTATVHILSVGAVSLAFTLVGSYLVFPFAEQWLGRVGAIFCVGATVYVPTRLFEVFLTRFMSSKS